MSWEPKQWDNFERSVDPHSAASIYFPNETPRFYPAMKEYLDEQRCLDSELAIRFGWYPAITRGPRIIIPCVRTDNYNFWQGRLLPNIASDAWFPGVDWPRWDSPHGPRGDALVHLQVPGASTVVIVEGPMDALAAAMTGCSAIAVLGIGAPGPVLAHVASLAVYYSRKIIVPDLDELRRWLKIQNTLGYMGVTASIREPWAKDLAEMEPSVRKDFLNA